MCKRHITLYCLAYILVTQINVDLLLRKAIGLY